MADVCVFSSEHQPHLDLPDSRRVRLRAHPAEVGVGNVGLDAAEDDRVEQIEHVDAKPKLHPANREVPVKTRTSRMVRDLNQD